MKQKLGFFALYILFPIFLIWLGVNGLRGGIEEYRLGKTMTGTAEGVISNSRISESTDSDGDKDYTTYFTLDYTVGENSYTWDTSLDGKYYDNDTIKVYYNPDDPTVVSLKTQGQKIRSILFSIVLIPVGIFVAVFGFMSRGKENKAEEYKEETIAAQPESGESKWHDID